eukprot:s1500_g6.t1
MVPVPLVGGAYSLRRVTVPTCWRGPCSWRGPGRRSRTETPAFAPREFANEVNLGSVQALEWLVALAKQKEMQKLQLPDAKAKVTLGTIAVGKASCCLHRWPSRRNAGIRPVIPHAEVALDAADLTVDDGWLDPLVPDAQCLSASPGQSSISPAEGVCSALGSTLRLAGRPIVEEYVARPSRDLDRGMPCFGTFWAVRAAIRLISLSGRFTLDGATLTLPRRSLPVSYRGSLHDLTRSLAAEYTVNLLRNVGTVLGKSSVLKLPRAPLKLAGTAMSLVRRPGLAAGEAAALLNELTFDEEFVARQRQQQGVKQIRGIGDGVVEAGKSIAQGVEGLLDVVKKPVQGARSSGIGGFFAGVGLGVAGSLVKPVSRLGQAISDVGVGLAAEVSPDSTQRRRSRARRRHPRLICSTVVGAAGLGGKPPPQIRVWSNVEAEVLHQLGVERLRGLQELHANHSVKSQQIPLRHGMQPLGANPSFSKSLSTWKDAARPCSTSELHRLLADARQLRSELLAAKGTVELAKQRLEEQGPRLVHAAEDFKRAAIEEKEAQELAEKSRRQDPAAEASAAIDAAAGAQPLQEEKCYEWLRMLREDKAVHAGIIAVEAECDYWEAQLQDHLVAALPRWKSSREGVQRLDAELQDLALDDRGTSGCDRCLEVLDRDHPRQPFCHLRGIYALLDDLRQRNDNLAAAQSGLRWQRLAEEGQCRSASPEKSPDRKADERYLPPGPKFFSVVQLLQPEDPPPPPEVPRMPKAVVSRSEWFSPWNPQAENGNSFLPSLISSRRLQPSETGSLSWGRPGSYCFEPSIFSSGDYWDPFGGPLPSKTPTSAEVLRRAFEEPLSEVLAGHSGRTGQRPSSAPRAPRKVPSSLEKRQRSGWVTFEATVQTPTSPSPSPNYAVTAPIQRPPPEWEALDSRSSGPARWEVAWPDSAAAFPAPAAALPELPPVPAAFPAPKVSELGFGWDAWEAQESVQLSD